MIARRFHSLAFVFLMPFTLSVLPADVTLRYKMDLKMNPALPAAMVEAAMKGMDSAVSQEHVLRFKDGRGFSTSMGYASITDFTTKEITILDAAGMRYARLKIRSVRRRNGPRHAGITCRCPRRSLIDQSQRYARPVDRPYRRHQGVEAEEREFTYSVEGRRCPTFLRSHDQDGYSGLDCQSLAKLRVCLPFVS